MINETNKFKNCTDTKEIVFFFLAAIEQGKAMMLMRGHNL